MRPAKCERVQSPDAGRSFGLSDICTLGESSTTDATQVISIHCSSFCDEASEQPVELLFGGISLGSYQLLGHHYIHTSGVTSSHSMLC